MKKLNLKEQAYDILKEKIINCEYFPGAFLSEQMLVEALSFSRTPIRDALSRLEQENLVEIMPKKGIKVTEVSLSDVRQIFQAREEIEPIALRLASTHLPKRGLVKFKESFQEPLVDIENGFKLDTMMHLFIIEHCGNQFIIDTMRKVFEVNTRVIISSQQNKINIHDARKEHIEVLDFIINEEYDKAEESMRNHIGQCKKAAMDFFYYQPIGTTKTNWDFDEQLKKAYLMP